MGPLEDLRIVTPLVETEAPQGSPPGIRFFLKREDLLPFGGGNKVRRLMHWRKAHPQCRELTVLSDYGSHTFYSLSQMAPAFDSLTFYERRCPSTPYREAVRKRYVDVPGVRIIQGSLPELWLHSQRDRRPRLGIGGSLPSSAMAYRDPMRACIEQLTRMRIEGPSVLHVFPIATGTMADGFLQELKVQPGAQHTLVGVLTGHPLTRPWLRLRYLREPLLQLVRAPRPLAAPQHGVFLDPNHGIYAWQALLHLVPTLQENSIVIFWITAPRP